MNHLFARKSLRNSLVLLCLTFNTFAFAQKNTTVHGKVLDAQTGEPLPYASVQLPEVSLGTRTDIDGNFFIESS